MDDILPVEQMRELLTQIAYKPGVELHLRMDGERPYLQASHWRLDVVTGKQGLGWSGKRPVTTKMTAGEFVRAVFGVLIALEEHECREWFTYAGKRIFGPHITLDALMSAADQTEYRP